MSEPIKHSALKTARCEGCGAEFTFEPVFVLGVGFGGPRNCEACCDAAERREHARQVQERQVRLQESWREVTREFRKISESDPAQIPAPVLWEYAMAWDYSTGRSVAFVAPYAGVGKSRSAMAALRRAHFAGRSCLPVAAVDFASDASFYGDGRERELAEQRLYACRRASVLLLDDIAKPKWTPAAEAELFAVLDERHRKGRPTIWTANAPTATIGGKWSEEGRAAILRRLTDDTDVAEILA